MQPPSELNRFALTAAGRRSRYGFCFVLREVRVRWTIVSGPCRGSVRVGRVGRKAPIPGVRRGVG